MCDTCSHGFDKYSRHSSREGTLIFLENDENRLAVPPARAVPAPISRNNECYRNSISSSVVDIDDGAAHVE